jgi:hypothetical protein
VNRQARHAITGSEKRLKRQQKRLQKVHRTDHRRNSEYG